MAKGPRPLVAGNWKMNGSGRQGLSEIDRLIELAGKHRRLRPEVLICPPATLLGQLGGKRLRSKLSYGGQDCHTGAGGAHTGDISAEMLKDCGCSYVIVGHSERRADHHEANALVRAKAEAAQRAGLIAVICIGETAAERRGGRTLRVVSSQLRYSLPEKVTAVNTVIAYEPVWAIGSGLTPTAEDVAEIHAAIRERLQRRLRSGAGEVRILYGGSVNASNAKELMAVANVDGALVGGASLKARDFWPIVEAKL